MKKRLCNMAFFVTFLLCSCNPVVLETTSGKSEISDNDYDTGDVYLEINFPNSPQELREEFFEQLYIYPAGGNTSSIPKPKFVDKTFSNDGKHVIGVEGLPSRKLSLYVYYPTNELVCNGWEYVYYFHIDFSTNSSGRKVITFTTSEDMWDLKFVLVEDGEIISEPPASYFVCDE